MDKERDIVIEELESYFEGIVSCALKHPASGIGYVSTSLRSINLTTSLYGYNSTYFSNCMIQYWIDRGWEYPWTYPDCE